jgi:predicted transcriptional regulator
MHVSTIKENAKMLINSLPDSSTWDDIMYEIYVKQKIDKGLKEVNSGKVIPHRDVKRLLEKK